MTLLAWQGTQAQSVHTNGFSAASSTAPKKAEGLSFPIMFTRGLQSREGPSVCLHFREVQTQPDKKDFQVPPAANPSKTWLVFIRLTLLSIVARGLNTRSFRSTGLSQPLSELVDEQVYKPFRKHGVMTSDLRETRWHNPTLHDFILGLTNENPLLRGKKGLLS